MKKSRLFAATIVLLLTAFSCSADPGLLVVGHGSPWKPWNDRFLSFVEDVRGALTREGIRIMVRGAFLEMAEPGVARVAEEMHKAGCDPIIVAPAFVMPTEHDRLDLPMMLGAFFCPHRISTLRKEGAVVKRAASRVVILDPVAGWDGALGRVLLQRARRLSKDPKREGLLVLVHGSKTFDSLVRHALAEHVTPVLAKGGFARVEYAFVGMGELAEGGQPTKALERAGRGQDAVIVVAAYLGLSPRQLFTKWPSTLKGGAAVRVSDEALFPHPAFAQALVRLVKQAMEFLAEGR